VPPLTRCSFLLQTEAAQAAIRMVKDIALQRGRVTMKQAVGLFRGTSVKLSQDLDMSAISGRGSGKDYDLGDAERLFELLLIDQAFEEEYVANGGGFSNAYIKVRTFALDQASLRSLETDPTIPVRL
jgi:bloom syndrome protein